ncbi:hypothetical protein E3N88_18573 [Mikania micrantha]|uniref:Uncharacterized protein n=1 Tax=Mikania micrantha TaxID=192012 RepID=A0A5N6NNR2_9ASTR|nr:hypothetical protein E3N88_18573 [Mikania micrantha]
MKMKIKKVLGGVDKVLLVEVRSGDGGSRRRWWRVLGEERGSGGGRGFQEATMMIDSGVAEMGFNPGRGLLLTENTTTHSSGCGEFVFSLLADKVDEEAKQIGSESRRILHISYHLVNLRMSEAFVSNCFYFAVLEVDIKKFVSVSCENVSSKSHMIEQCSHWLRKGWLTIVDVAVFERNDKSANGPHKTSTTGTRLPSSRPLRPLTPTGPHNTGRKALPAPLCPNSPCSSTVQAPGIMLLEPPNTCKFLNQDMKRRGKRVKIVAKETSGYAKSFRLAGGPVVISHQIASDGLPRVHRSKGNNNDKILETLISCEMMYLNGSIG